MNREASREFERRVLYVLDKYYGKWSACRSCRFYSEGGAGEEYDGVCIYKSTPGYTERITDSRTETCKQFVERWLHDE